jgi:hypothetical protein
MGETIEKGESRMSQAKLRMHRNRDVSLGCGHKSQRAVRKLWLEALETRVLLSATLLDEPQLPVAPGQAGQHGRLPADVLERAPWVAGLGWQLSKDLFIVPEDLASDVELRAATPPAARATPAKGGSKSVAAADGSSDLQASSPTGQAPFGATVTDPSEFMIGDVWVTLVLLESNGAVDPQTENWSTTRIGQVKNEVLEGAQWWEDTLQAQFPNSLQELNITVDFTYADTPVPTAYEPINHGIADQSLWIDSFLNHVGYNTASSFFTDLDRWNHDQRLANGADWALTAFVVDSLADTDGKFSDGYFAYAYLGGPFLMMTYDNNGWGNSRMGQVFAHEFAHIFYALDEYPGSNAYTSTSGYYNIQNLNAYDGHPNPASRVASLMAESSLQGPAYTNHTSSPTSLQMVGWRDSDNDGVFDVLDVPLTLTGSGSYDAASGQYSFSGSSNVNTLQNLNPYGYRRNITTNTVDTLQYRIDGNAWISGNTYGAYSTSVSQVVNVSGLAAGTHTIEFRTIVDTLNVSSNVVSSSFAVVGSNAPPAANPDAATTNEDTPVVIGVLANDSDADGDPLTIQSVTQGAHGIVTINPDGTLTFAPSANYYGSDSFSYTVSDGRGGTAAALVSVIVASVNDPPVVNPDAAITNQDTPVTIAVLANDSDVDGDWLTIQSVTQGAHGIVTVNPDGTLTFAPTAGYSGNDSFGYTVSDGQGGMGAAVVSVTILAVNHAPVATDDAATTSEDTPVVIGVLANDSDADGDPLTIQSVTQGAHGIVTVNPDGTLTFAPSANYYGSDSFSYTVSDGRDGTAAAIVSVTVVSVNDAPVAKSDLATTNQGTPVTIAVLANDSDVDGDPLSVVAVTQGTGGSVLVNADGTVTYTPAASFSGSDGFTYTASDGQGGTATAGVTVQVQPAVKFFVVDNGADDTFRYNAAGQYVSRSDLASKNTDPRGVTTTADGQKLWVLNYNKIVYVYNAAGALLGSWSSSQLKQPTGIATDGTNIWIVDKSTDTVYRYNNAVGVTSGALTANSTFKLTSGNTTPEGITTDGTKLWVVNSGSPDKVFVYNLSGGSLGSWTIDSANGSPTGLTIDPTGASQSIWIVDVSKDRVYEYANARSRTSGSQAASTSFALAPGNTSPQGIADPDGSLRAMSAMAPAADGDSTVLLVAPNMPDAARQPVNSVGRQTGANFAHKVSQPVLATRLHQDAQRTKADRGLELAAAVSRDLASPAASPDVLAALSAESRFGWPSEADRLFADFAWLGSLDGLTP